jgi:hypothetical protein
MIREESHRQALLKRRTRRSHFSCCCQSLPSSNDTEEVGHWTFTGVAKDQISPDAKTFNQRWFVDGKRVQVVVGNNKITGNVIKAWEIRVTIKTFGDRPLYSPVP